MKKYLLFLPAFIGMLLLSNCQTEEPITEEHQHQKNILISEKSFEEVMKDERFSQGYKKLPPLSPVSDAAVAARSAMEDAYGFTIADYPVKIVETEGRISYTMLIYRDVQEEGRVENLVIQVYDMQQSEAVIVKYIVPADDEDGDEKENNPKFDGIEKMSTVYSDLGRGLLECITITRSLCNGIPYDCGGTICGFRTDTYCVGGGGPGKHLTIAPVTSIEGPPGSGGGGGSSSGTPATGSPNQEEPDPDAPQEPADHFEDIVTIPLIKETKGGPCADLKAKSADEEFVAKMAELKIAAGNTAQNAVESAYATYNSGEKYSEKQFGGIDQDGTYLELGYDNTRDVTGFMHCHMDHAAIKNLAVFSLDDMVMFGTMIENSTAPLNSFTIYVTSAKGTFALKITDKQAFINSVHKILLAQVTFDENYAASINGNQSASAQSNAFLKFMREKNILGTELYSCNPAFKNWNLLTLNENGTTNYAGC